MKKGNVELPVLEEPVVIEIPVDVPPQISASEAITEEKEESE